MSMDLARLSDAARGLNLNQHALLICDSPECWCQVVGEVARQGLLRGDRVMFLHGLYPPGWTMWLWDEGRNQTPVPIRPGQLIYEKATDLLLSDGWLEPKAVITNLSQAAVDACQSGFNGLRLIMDMNWASYQRGAQGQLPQLERLIHQVIVKLYPCLVLCHYQRQLFPGEFLATLQRGHHQVISDRPLGQPAEDRAETPPRRRGAADDGLVWAKG